LSAGTIAAQPSLLPRPPGGNVQGAALALIAHAGLIAALAYGVAWRSPAPDVVSAELWAAVPQIAAPRAAQPEPAALPPPVTKAAPPAVPAPTPAPTPKVALPDPQIAIEKAKKEQAAKLEKAEREKELQAKAAREKEAREKAERDKAERQQEAADAARLAQQREDNLKRMLGQIAGSPGGTGTAAVDAGPSASYAGRLVRAIKPNIVLTDSITGNPAAEVEVRAAPNGSIIGRRLLKSSGSKEWDEAVLRAIDRTDTLPRDTDGRVPATLVISFRPRD
jgi:colicin import membrane protein